MTINGTPTANRARIDSRFAADGTAGLRLLFAGDMVEGRPRDHPQKGDRRGDLQGIHVVFKFEAETAPPAAAKRSNRRASEPGQIISRSRGHPSAALCVLPDISEHFTSLA